MNEELLKWGLVFAVGLAGFVLGGGWPAKTYRRWSDAQLHSRLDNRYVLQVLYGADQRENALRHDQKDEIMGLIRDGQKAVLALTGAVERATEGVKYANERIQGLEEDVDEIKRGRPQGA